MTVSESRCSNGVSDHASRRGFWLGLLNALPCYRRHDCVRPHFGWRLGFLWGALRPLRGHRGRRLAELNIGQADVAAITYVLQRGGASRTSRGAVLGVTAWASLESCRGSVAIQLDARCRIKQTWVRGECQMPGLKNY